MREIPKIGALSADCTAVFLAVNGWFCVIWFPLLVIVMMLSQPRNANFLVYIFVFCKFGLPSLLIGAILIVLASWVGLKKWGEVLLSFLALFCAIALLVVQFILHIPQGLDLRVSFAIRFLLLLASAVIVVRARRIANKLEQPRV